MEICVSLPISNTCPPAFTMDHYQCLDSGLDTFGFKQDGCSHCPTCWLPALHFKPAWISPLETEPKCSIHVPFLSSTFPESSTPICLSPDSPLMGMLYTFEPKATPKLHRQVTCFLGLQHSGCSEPILHRYI